MSRVFFILIFAATASLASVHSVDMAEFERANALFDAGQYAEAKRAYENVAKSDRAGANIFYNLGNAEYRLGNPARAALAYERALALDPAHADARANLSLVRKATNAKVEPVRWLESVFPQAGGNFFAWCAVIFVWLGIFSIASALLIRGQLTPRLWIAGALLFLAAFYSAAGGFFAVKKTNASLVVEKSADARLAPAETAPAIASLPAASRVRVMSVRGAWSHCTLPDGKQGWILSAALEPIRPRS
jgi:tetratricopeptide (TPR) repeat protein